MLHNPSMEAANQSIYDITELIKPFIVNARKTWHYTAQTRYRQATFPAIFEFVANRRYCWINQHSVWHLLCIWVARILTDTKNHHLQGS